MSLERFDDLYEKYCDALLTDGERDEFTRLLEDPALRARFAELSVFAAVVADELKVLGESASTRASSRRLPAVRRRPAPRAARTPVFAWVAAAAAALLFTVALGTSTSRPRPSVPRETASRPAPEVPAPAPSPIVVPVPPSAPRKIEKVEQRDPEPLVVPPAPSSAPVPSGASEGKPAPPKIEVPAPRPPAPSPATRPAEPVRPPKATRTMLARVESGVDALRLPERTVAAEGVDLAAGEGVETGAAGSAVLRLPDGTRVELAGDARLTASTERSLHLERGAVLVKAAKQAPGSPLSLTAPQAEVQVLGTEFSVFAGGAFTRVDVREGRVKVLRMGGVSSVFLNAGQFAVVGPDHEFAARTAWFGFKLPAAGQLVWLRGDVGVKAEGGAVAVWQDQSGNGLHATAPSVAARPTLVPGLRPALRFDGAGDHLTFPPGFADFRAGLSVFVVGRLGAGQTQARLVEFGTGNNCDYIALSRWTAPTTLSFWAYANTVTRGKIHAANAVAPGELQTLSAVMLPGGRSTVYRGGQPVDAGPTSQPAVLPRTSNFIGKTIIGGEPTLRGELSEILIYNRALADAERAYVEAYLNLKYFDATTPPAFAAR